MKIAVIGAGNVGTALSKSFVRAGHQVTMAARDPQKTRAAADQAGASAATSPSQAAAASDVVVLAVPYGAAKEVADGIRDTIGGKVVIDVTNPLKPDMSGVATAEGPSGAERLAKWLPDAQVAKAFNTIFASVQADPTLHGQPVDALFATDDDETRVLVAELADSIGFRPVDAGPLARARELEAIAFLNISLQIRHKGDWRTAISLVGAPARATAVTTTTRP